MTQNKSTQAFRLSNTNSPLRAEFHAVELLEEASRLAGWDTEYHQLDPGPFTATVRLCPLDGTVVMRERLSKRAELVGQLPGQVFSVIIPNRRLPVVVHGHTVGPRGVLLVAPGAQAQIASRAAADVLSITVSLDGLEGTTRDQVLRHPRLRQGTFTPVDVDEDTRRALTYRALSALRDAPDDRHDHDALTLNALLLRGIFADDAEPAMRRDSRRRALARARDYIEGQLDEPISMSELCEHSGTSLSTLERAFREALGMSPSSYLVARRLAAVRRRLIDGANADRSIAEIAFDHGFSHLGRFAAAYRRHFGHSPRTARRIAARSAGVALGTTLSS